MQLSSLCYEINFSRPVFFFVVRISLETVLELRNEKTFQMLRYGSREARFGLSRIWPFQ